jgi:hypothetical protein
MLLSYYAALLATNAFYDIVGAAPAMSAHTSPLPVRHTGAAPVHNSPQTKPRDANYSSKRWGNILRRRQAAETIECPALPPYTFSGTGHPTRGQDGLRSLFHTSLFSVLLSIYFQVDFVFPILPKFKVVTRYLYTSAFLLPSQIEISSPEHFSFGSYSLGV